DGRVRDILMYYGAGTGRWSSKGPQFQNFKRGKAASELLVEAITTGNYDLFVAMYGENVIPLLKSAVKSIIKAPPGRKFVISDFAGIEARVLQWLAGHERVLQMFRDGVDIYIDMACQIYD